jgi:uncharacterized Zn-finger protein
MISQPNLKRAWCMIALMSATVTLVVGLITHDPAASANSQTKFSAPNSAQYLACAGSAAHNDHPKPWLKIVVSHLVSVATRLAV